MKKIKIYTLTSLITLLTVFACEEKLTTFEGPYHVRFTSTSSAIDENATTPASNSVHFAGPTPTEAISIQLSVSGGQEGVDFEFIEGGTSLTIQPGEFFADLKISPIDNDEADGDKKIVFTIESASGGFGAGFGLVGKTFTYSIADDDCATPSLEGTYLVVNRDATPASCGNPANDDDLTYEATITLVSDVDGVRTYLLSDITGGLYSLCYGEEEGENPGIITTTRFSILLEAQPDVVYGDDEFNGTGQMDCEGNFTLSWANGFGDRATSHYTRK